MSVDAQAASMAASPTESVPITARDPVAFRILVLAVLLGVMAELLFFERPPGISFPVFVAAALLAMWNASDRHRSAMRDSRTVVLLAAAALISAAFVFVRAKELLIVLNLGATAALLGLVAVFLRGGRLSDVPLVGLALGEASAALYAAVLPFQLASRAVDLRSGGDGARSLLPVVRGVALAVPVLLVFVALLGSADLVFQGYVNEVLSIDLFANLMDWMVRLGFVAIVAWGAAGWMGVPAQAADLPLLDADDDDSAILPGIRRFFRIGFAEATTVLTLVATLFGLFVAVQITYFFGGEQAIGVEGFTYAEYARRGFFELLAVGALTLAMLLGLNDLTARTTPRQKLVFRALGTVLVGLVLVMLLSSYQRLSLYESAYGYTELRLIVHAFLVWLGMALVWCAFSLWTRPRRFAAGALACAFGFLVTLDLVNMDALIVQRNVDRFVVTGDLDIEYLSRLSSDAVPDLRAAVDRLPAAGADSPRALLEAELARRADRLTEQPGKDIGPSLNLGHWRAWQAVRPR